jgi:hypothetical protein
MPRSESLPLIRKLYVPQGSVIDWLFHIRLIHRPLSSNAVNAASSLVVWAPELILFKSAAGPSAVGAAHQVDQPAAEGQGGAGAGKPDGQASRLLGPHRHYPRPQHRDRHAGSALEHCA